MYHISPGWLNPLCIHHALNDLTKDCQNHSAEYGARILHD